MCPDLKNSASLVAVSLCLSSVPDAEVVKIAAAAALTPNSSRDKVLAVSTLQKLLEVGKLVYLRVQVSQEPADVREEVLRLRSE